MPIIMLKVVCEVNNRYLRYFKIESQTFNMLENALQNIASDFAILHELWNIPSRVYRIVAYGRVTQLSNVMAVGNSTAQSIHPRCSIYFWCGT